MLGPAHSQSWRKAKKSSPQAFTSYSCTRSIRALIPTCKMSCRSKPRHVSSLHSCRTGRIQISIAIELVAACAGGESASGLKGLQDSISRQNTLRAYRGARPHAPQALPQPRSRNIRPETCFGPFSLSPRRRKNAGAWWGEDCRDKAHSVCRRLRSIDRNAEKAGVAQKGPQPVD